MAAVESIDRTRPAEIVVHGVECRTQMGALKSYLQMLEFVETLYAQGFHGHVASIRCSPSKVLVTCKADLKKNVIQAIDKACISVGWEPLFNTAMLRKTEHTTEQT